MTDAEVVAFIGSFEDASLPRAEWTHAKHLVMALWYLSQYPRDEATRRIRDGIRRLNARHGNEGGYHETITLAWVALITRFLAGREPGESIATRARALLAELAARDVLMRYYSRELLLSDEARRGWVAPDREPLEP